MNDFSIDLSKYGFKNDLLSPQKHIDSISLDGTKSFESLMLDSLKEVNDLQIESGKMIQRLATGDVDDISEVVLASSRAEVALRMLMEIRNKLVEAYQQISRIQS